MKTVRKALRKFYQKDQLGTHMRFLYELSEMEYRHHVVRAIASGNTESRSSRVSQEVQPWRAGEKWAYRWLDLAVGAPHTAPATKGVCAPATGALTTTTPDVVLASLIDLPELTGRYECGTVFICENQRCMM